jgi:riboflavin kinase/FMN adenylyltransferase
MKVIDLKHRDRRFALRECGLVLGNFDGLHRGHRALINELKRLNTKRRPRLPLGALCFSTPPSAHLGIAVPQLSTNEEKFALMREAGLRFVVLLDFPEVMHLDPMDFVKDILIRDCHCMMAVCGFNYTFGAKAAGKAEDLANWLGTQPRREVSIVPAVTDGRHTVSSSEIRRSLEQGHPEDATRMLGRPYVLTGKVLPGKSVGHTMGYPTANLVFPKGALIPARGVYAVTVKIGRRTYLGISNVGTRPTFDDGDSVTCETFLFDFSGNLYDRPLTVSFLRFLRPERAFPSLDALQAQIREDILRTREFFNA